MVQFRKERMGDKFRNLHFLFDDETHAVLLDIRSAIQLSKCGLIIVTQH